MEEIVIKSLAEFQKNILELKGEYLYRGQADSDWFIESGAYRRLSNNNERDLYKYTFDIINKAKHYTQDIDINNEELDLLADLQHYGCATPLIDFTANALISLWFATENLGKNGKNGKNDKSGKVFCLKTDGDKFLEVSKADKKQPLNEILTLTFREKSKIYKFGKWIPPLNNNRIITQNSVFIFTPTGTIGNDDFDVIFTIKKDSKKEIRKQLKIVSNITEDNIYPDFHGFAMNNGATKNYKEATANELNEKGLRNYRQGDYNEAIRRYKLALKSDLKTYGEDHPAVARDRNNLGGAWHSLGKYKKAIGYYELALKSDLKTYGEDHPDVAIDHNNLGSAWKSLGKYKKAIGYYELALKSDLKTYGEDHPDVAIDHNNLGSAWKSLGKYKKAIGYYELALKSDLKTYGKNHPTVAIRLNNLGGAWHSLEQYEKAIGYYELALKSDLKTYGEDHPTVATYHNNLGGAWYSLGKYKKAIGYFELALKSDLKAYGEDHPDVATYRNNLAEAKKVLANKTK
ncbi:Oligopeptide ABC transporter, substrate-binding protein OppA (TC 3.A.1.5.1) [uncultured Gammaproteobacteria bacterium]|jgi:tetratricopeptide (TPR) repeat protein|nr:Oligopeptide ABC transporter, substrate-binding protein OppA (TC 3.A.1.5.1) [uncultured Gammaproteobacteria bacterium]